MHNVLRSAKGLIHPDYGVIRSLRIVARLQTLDSSEFARWSYRLYLYREPDAAGLAHMSEVLKNDSILNRLRLIKGLTTSAERESLNKRDQKLADIAVLESAVLELGAITWEDVSLWHLFRNYLIERKRELTYLNVNGENALRLVPYLAQQPSSERLRAARVTWQQDLGGARLAASFTPKDEAPDILMIDFLANARQINHQRFHHIFDELRLASGNDASILKLTISNGTVPEEVIPGVHYQLPDRAIELPVQYEQTRNSLISTLSAIRPTALVQDFGEYADHFVTLRHHYQNLLQELRPRFVVTASCHHTHGMAVINASNTLGIPTMDVQHGLYGTSQEFTTLERLGEVRSSLLPRVFWLWSDRDVDHIGQRLDPKFHDVFLGGIVQYHGWHNGTSPQIQVWARQRPGFDTLLDKREYTILVAHQADIERLDEWLTDILKQLPNALFLIRLHPLQAADSMSIDRLLRAKGLDNFELINTTRAPLYGLFEICTHVVGSTSSVLLEAVNFGLPAASIVGGTDYIINGFVETGLLQRFEASEALPAWVAATSPTERARHRFVDVGQALKEIMDRYA